MQSIILLSLLTMIIQGCHMGSRMTASLLAIELGANPFLLGVLIAVYSLFPLLLAVLTGRLCDRYGSRYPMLSGAGALGLGLLLPYLWPSLPMLYASAALIGVGFVLFNVAAQNLAGGLDAPEHRTRNFSNMGLGYAAGHMAGPLIAGFAIDSRGYAFAYLCLVLLALLPVALLARNRSLNVAPPAAARETGSAFGMLRNVSLRRAIITSGLVTSGMDLYTFYVPIYGHSINLSASTIGALLGMFAAAAMVVRIVLPAVTRRYGVEKVLSTAMFSAALFFLPFSFIEFVPALFALSFGIGLALGCGQPLTLNLAYNRSPPGRSGEVTGLRLTINNMTHISVPLAAGVIGSVLGVTPVFWASAALLVTSGMLVRNGN